MCYCLIGKYGTPLLQRQWPQTVITWSRTENVWGGYSTPWSPLVSLSTWGSGNDTISIFLRWNSFLLTSLDVFLCQFSWKLFIPWWRLKYFLEFYRLSMGDAVIIHLEGALKGLKVEFSFNFSFIFFCLRIFFLFSSTSCSYPRLVYGGAAALLTPCYATTTSIRIFW